VLQWLYAFALGLAACGGDDPGSTRFVGTFDDGGRALVFAVRDPSQTNAYACDGTSSPALFEWFVNAGSDDLQTIDSDGGAAQIELDFAARTGTLTTEVARTFTLVPVEPQFGLYRGTATEGDADYEAGIILLDDDVQNGVIGIVSPRDGGSLTTVVSPAIVPDQRAITLLNDVRIPIASALNAYAR
jgi:hypothetical protein